MKVRIAYTIDAEDWYRRAIAHWYGNHGELATREQIRRWNEEHGTERDDDLGFELERCWMGCGGEHETD